MLSFDLYAVAYRTTLLNDQPKLQIWEESLKLGERLPTVPLWLDDDLCIPLDLEATYSESRKAQRIPEIL